MPLKFGLYLSGDSQEFSDAALAWSETSGALCLPICSDASMVSPASSLPAGEVEQLAIFSHGTTTSLGKPGRWGIDTRQARQGHGQIISPTEFAAVWAPKLAQGALISLAACLCGRSRHWYLTKLYGKAASPWGAESYEDGGATSLAIQLVRAFTDAGVRVKVRAHCAAGHTTHQALLREFRPRLGIGLSLFRMVVGPTKTWTLTLRNAWQRIVKGELAERWLLGDADVAADIKDRFTAFSC